jgi:lipopolysaccharide/colanic/teichoic acid biosynthesis glycosyltransferase
MISPKLSRRGKGSSPQGPSQADPESPEVGDYSFYSKPTFNHMLRIERHRTERSKRSILLLLIDLSTLSVEQLNKDTIEKIKAALSTSLRETDIRGWSERNRIIGVIFTEMESLDESSIDGVVRKIYNRFSEKLDAAIILRISISYHIYPETKGSVSSSGTFNLALYPELNKNDFGYRCSMAAKTVIDAVGSTVALLLFSPFFFAISVAIKWDSEGPVFFRQKRLGLNGRTFDLLKFRSMCTNADCADHQEYIKKYIGEQKTSAVEPGVYKLSNDSRVTRVGRILRKGSLDELPQLINVFKGEMSLVGPRPPIPYECELYDIWHRRRLLSCKPGITGLWQVTGRSRTTFDEMVRLDLKYINEWSLWLDLKILFKTPKAVLSGEGAY